MISFCQRIVASRVFDPVMLVVIAVNAIVLGLGTYDAIEEAAGDTLNVVNDVILGIFVVELTIRFLACFPRPLDYFRSGWNVFDFVVVSASFVPGVRENATLLRLVRLLRVVRAVRLLPDLRVLTVAVARSIPGVASLAIITLLLIYIYGMVGWVLFDESDPENFGNIGEAMLTMFILLSLEDLPTYIETGNEATEWAVPFYVSYVLIAAFLVFNLFIGIVINSMEEARAIELHRAELELLDSDDANDEAAHAVILAERMHRLRDALEALEREVAAQKAAR